MVGDGALSHELYRLGFTITDINMATDILAGTQAGMRTVLVLSGVTRQDELERYPYQPNEVYASVGEIEIDEW